jgi:integrase
LILWLGFFAGLRRREIDQARRDWVDLEAGVIQVRVTDTFSPKSKRGVRTIRLSPRLAEFLRGYLERPPERPRRLRKADGETRELIVLPAAHPGDYLVRPDRLPGKKVKTRGKRANRYRFDARRPFNDHVQSIGLGWVGFHTMRHTWATLHALAGTPLTTLAKELGEEAATCFEHYVGYQREGGHAGAVD